MALTTITELADGHRKVFHIPVHTKAAQVAVNGAPALIASQADSSVTLKTAPAAGASVAITYTPLPV